MRKCFVGLFAGAAMLVLATGVSAQTGKSTTNQGSTPSGRPFQQIQGQILSIDQQLADMQQQINDLNARITQVQQDLQSQIDGINLTLAGLQAQIASVQDVTASLQAHLAADDSLIQALETAEASLQAQLAAAQAQLATLQGQTNSNTSAIYIVQGQINNIQGQLNAYASQIQSLQQQNGWMTTFLNNLANGTCSYGSAISDIGPQGQIQCVHTAGSLTTMTAYNFVPLGYGFNSGSAACPAGWTRTGGGFSAPAYNDWISYVTSIQTGGFGWLYWYYDGHSVSATNVTASIGANAQYQSASVEFTPHNYYGGYYFTVSADCSKVQ